MKSFNQYVNNNSTAIIIIDMIHEFCSPGGWADLNGLDYTYCDKCIQPINKLISYGRSLNLPIIWVNWGMTESDILSLPKNQYLLWKKKPDEVGLEAGLFRKGTKRVEVIPELDKQDEDYNIDKVRMTGFYQTELNNLLKQLKITKILFAGVNTDQCVLSTMADAHFIGYDCIMVTDCCATTSPPYAERGAVYNAGEVYGKALKLNEII